MWIHFKCKKGRRFVIRPFVGGVNGITGEPHTGDMSSMLRHPSLATAAQDYLVIPQQIWLGGIATKPGVVRQFVATESSPPRRGDMESQIHSLKAVPQHETASQHTLDADDRAGSSVEWQMTGQDTLGGIQLQIIPAFDVQGVFAGSSRHVCPKSAGSTELRSYDIDNVKATVSYDVLQSPSELGLHVGDFIHVKDMRSLEGSRSKVVSDVMIETPGPPGAQWDFELKAKYSQGPTGVSKWTFGVSVYPYRTLLTLEVRSWSPTAIASI